MRRRVLLIVLVFLGLMWSDLTPVQAQPKPEAEARRSARDLAPLESTPAPGPEVEEVGDFSHDPSFPRQRREFEVEGFDQERSVEVEEETTETQQVFDNPDGTQTAVIHQAPVRFKDDAGAWQDVDLGLVEEGADGTLTPRSAPNPVEIATGEEGLPVSVETAAGEVTARHLDEASGNASEAADPTVEGQTARFDDVLSGRRDLTVETTSTGWEESVILPDASSAPSYLTELTVPEGVTGREVAGAVELVDGDGEIVGVFGGGYAHDADVTRSGVGAETEVTSSIVGQEGTTVTIEVSIDDTWLQHPKREFPVVIDPVFSTTAASGIDTWVQNSYSSSQAASTELRVGTYNGGTHVANSMIKFGIGVTPNSRIQVTKANLSLYNNYSYACEATALNVAGLASSPSTSTVWSNQPKPDAAGIVNQVAFAKGYSGSCPAGWVDIPIEPLAQRWLTGAPNHGLKLWAVDEWDSYSWKKFASIEAGSTGPKLSITYSHLPTQATHNNPPHEATLSTTQPVLMANPGSDIDGDALKYRFKVGTGTDADTGSVADSGWISSTNWRVPANVLQDGVTYYWKVHTWDQVTWPEESNWVPRKFKVDLRLGEQSAVAYDEAGPVKVNLYNGNVVFETGSPTYSTVGGEIGFSYTYNSKQPSNAGLTAQYFDESMGADRLFNEAPFIERRDPQVNLSWGNGAPAAGMSADHFLSRWTGYVTAPVAGTYQFGAYADDGVRVWVNNAIQYDRWSDASGYSPGYKNSITLAAGQTVPIKVEHYEKTGGAHVQLYVKGAVPEQIVPADWLSTNAPALPHGWTMSADLEGSLGYTQARVGDKAVTLVDAGGATTTYTWTGALYKPPTGEHGILTKNADKTLLLQAEDGMNYVFDVGGRLISATSSLDDTNAAAARYTWGGSPARLTAVTDPVSGRKHQLFYAGSASCPTVPTGFTAPPAQMLCGIQYWDGSRTSFFYRSGQLARIDDPGAEVTDLGYTSGRLNKVRDTLAADMVAAGLRVDDDTTRTVIAYDSVGRPSSVTLPAPTPGAPRPQQSYVYGPTSTDVKVLGMPMPAGYERRVEFDSAGRTLKDIDAAGKVSTFEWHPGDLPKLSIDAAGLKTSTIYEPYRDRPSEQYGPAPSAWFGADGKPTSTYAAKVPRTQTRYDEGMNGLAATYYANKDLRPEDGKVRHDTTSGGLTLDWKAGAPAGMPVDNFSARFSGDITFPTVGDYKLEILADDGVRMWLDDNLVINSWTAAAGWKPAYVHKNPLVNRVRRLRIEYFEGSVDASVHLYWTPPGGTRQLVPGSALTPRYGLATTQIDADNRVTKTQYAKPHYGNVTATVDDPGGLALRTETDFETAAGGYQRQVARRLPKGPATQVDYRYYGATETRAIPAVCGGSTSVGQAGQLKQTLEPVTSSGSRIDRQSIYDLFGRVIASSDDGGSSWSCTTYDVRGRVTKQRDRAGRLVNTSYATPGVTQTDFHDSGGTMRSTRTDVDLLGRVVRYVDEFGTVSRNVYDQAGRMVETYRQHYGAAEKRIWTAGFDAVGRQDKLTDELSGTPRTTSYAFDSIGRLATVTRPNGVVTTNSYKTDTGRLVGIGHARSGANLASWSGVHKLGGDLESETTAGRTRGYKYDNAGRLTEVNDAGTIRRYAYDRNTNRCGLAASCQSGWSYDNADRILASPGSTYSYDARGNVTSINQSNGGVTQFTYDANNHATVIDDPTNRVEETLAPDGRVLIRRVVDKATGNEVSKTSYGYDDKSDSPAYEVPATGDRVAYLDGPGGVLAIQTGSKTVWPLGNARGDIIGTTDNAGAYTAKPVADEFGKASSVTADRLGWLGMHQRYTASATSGIIRMGHRLYDPRIGRFLQVDPIEGGSDNDYDYVGGDPINETDLDGQVCWRCWRKKAWRGVRRGARWGWRNRGHILGAAGIIGCAVATAGACAVIGAAGAANSIVSSAWGKRRRGWRRMLLAGATDGLVSYAGSRVPLGRWGHRAGRWAWRSSGGRRGVRSLRRQAYQAGRFHVRFYGGAAVYAGSYGANWAAQRRI